MRRAVYAALLGCLLAGPVSSQPTPTVNDSALAGFIAQARSGTERYRDRSAAIADGFRLIGVDFPSMGEHWISLQRVMKDTFDVARPSMLTYITVDGAPVLAGVGYTALLEPGELPPDFAPARGFWHEHNGSIIDESLPHHHRRAMPGAGNAGHAGHGKDAGRAEDAGHPARRFSLLHAWVWTENPDGVFHTDNWTLPAHRLGIAPDEPLSQPARHMITLGLRGTPYYAVVLRGALSPSAAEEEVIARILEGRRGGVAELLGPVRSSRKLDAETLRQLEVQWSAMWGELTRDLPRHAAALGATREQLEHPEGRLAVD